MFVVEDIEIFIMTYNRAEYLIQSIESILAQIAGIKSLTVFDNNSTDNTEELVKNLESRGVKYIKTFGFLGNFNKAKEIASKKYVMLFHDDDILHPQYIELAIKALNKYKNVSLITTRYTEFNDDNVPEFSKNISSAHYLFKKQKDFAKHMYFVERIAYSPAIYRTKDFLKTPLEYDKFNKFNDWPFMVKIAGCGQSVLFDDDAIYFARRHKDQDTWTSTNTPSLEQIVNWDKFFYDKMKIRVDFFSKSKMMFKLKCKIFLKGKYNAFLPKEDKEKYSLESLWKLANKKKIYSCTKNISLEKISKIQNRFLKRLVKKNKHESL